MYCPSCGTAVPQNLSFCHRCGAKVNGANKSTELSPETLVWAIVSVFVVGLGAVLGLTAMTKDGVGVDPVGLALALLSFMLMIVVEGVLLWLLLRVLRGAREAGEAGRRLSSEQTTKELVEAEARALPEPASSVTEHTTRIFEPAYGERKSK